MSNIAVELHNIAMDPGGGPKEPMKGKRTLPHPRSGGLGERRVGWPQNECGTAG